MQVVSYWRRNMNESETGNREILNLLQKLNERVEHCERNQRDTELVKTKLEKAESRIRYLETKLTESIPTSMKDFGSARRQLVSTKANIAFSAYISGSAIRGLGTNQLIQFDRLHANEGQAYDVNTGYFTCIEAGFYAFSLSITSVSNQRAEIELMVGSVRALEVYAADHNGAYDQGSNFVIIHCGEGDQVYVRTRGGGIGVDGADWSHFSGFLLF